MPNKVLMDCYTLAQRYVGIKEMPGSKKDHMTILAMLRLDDDWPEHDEVPWCSAFVNWIAWHLHLPRSKSLLARSWLLIGHQSLVPEIGNDVVVLAPRGPGSGHVGFFAGLSADGSLVSVLGGNQSNQVSIAGFPHTAVLDYRRLF